MRAEKRSGGASIEILNIARQTASRQYEKRSRARVASVDHVSTCTLADVTPFALSANLVALLAKIVRARRCMSRWCTPIFRRRKGCRLVRQQDGGYVRRAMQINRSFLNQDLLADSR